MFSLDDPPPDSTCQLAHLGTALTTLLTMPAISSCCLGSLLERTDPRRFDVSNEPIVRNSGIHAPTVTPSSLRRFCPCLCLLSTPFPKSAAQLRLNLRYFLERDTGALRASVSSHRQSLIVRNVPTSFKLDLLIVKARSESVCIFVAITRSCTNVLLHHLGLNPTDRSSLIIRRRSKRVTTE